MGRAVQLEALLRAMRAQGASDLHLAAGATPRMRIDGALVALDGEVLDVDDVSRLCEAVLAGGQQPPRGPLDEAGEVAVAFETSGLGRFRVSLFRRSGNLGAVFHAVPIEVWPLPRLGVPEPAEALCERPRGLVLVTGPTGSGRSTTLAAMIDRLTSDRQRHVVTMEDPIEHIHTASGGLVTQRELGRDTRSIQRAVRAALRQDADVVAIGELAEAESVEAALTAADAGHLCLAAARGASVIQAIARLVDLFPPQRQPQVRAQLAHLLDGIVNQRLIPRAAGGGRVLAVEMLVPTPATRALIRDDSLPSLYAHMQAGPAAAGMQTLNRCLADLYLARQITLESAVAHSADPTELQQLIAAGGDTPAGPIRQPGLAVAARRS